MCILFLLILYIPIYNIYIDIYTYARSRGARRACLYIIIFLGQIAAVVRPVATVFVITYNLYELFLL